MAYLKHCVPILEQIDELDNVIQQRQTELMGPIKIAAPTAFGSSELVTLLQPFMLAHPQVSIDLSLNDQRVAIVEDGFDLALRFGQLTDSNLIARKLTDMRSVTVASPAYLERYGEPLQPETLSTHNCLIDKAALTPNHWTYKVKNEVRSISVKGGFSANSPRAIATMAAGGVGIGRCPFYVVSQFIRDNKLKILLEGYETSGFSLYAIYPQNRHLTARIRALIDFLVESLKGVY